MHKKSTLLFLLTILLMGSPLLAADGTMNADEIIAKNIETLGGQEAWDNLDTVRASGSMDMGGGMQAPFTIFFKSPDKVRLEFEIQGMTGIQAFDGTTGWQVMPFLGKTEAEKMNTDEQKQIEDMAEFKGHFYNYKEKGHTIEYVGTEEVEGTEAHKLKVTKKNGDVTYSYLDTEHFLEFRQERTAKFQGSEMDVVVTLGDFKEVGDIIMMHSMQNTMPDTGMSQTITMTKVERDLELADDLFAMPEPQPAEEAAE